MTQMDFQFLEYVNGRAQAMASAFIVGSNWTVKLTAMFQAHQALQVILPALALWRVHLVWLAVAACLAP